MTSIEIIQQAIDKAEVRLDEAKAAPESVGQVVDVAHRSAFLLGLKHARDLAMLAEASRAA